MVSLLSMWGPVWNPGDSGRCPQIRSAAVAAPQGPSATRFCGTPRPHNVIKKTPRCGDCNWVRLEDPPAAVLAVETKDVLRASDPVCASVGRHMSRSASHTRQGAMSPPWDPH